MTDWRSAIAIIVGAGIGGFARYLVGLWFVRQFGPGFPYGTFFINVSGSFLFGFVIQASQTAAFGLTPLMRFFLATGFCGGYTTFSTFSYEMLTLGAEGSLLALGYAVGSVVLGMSAAYLGIFLARVASR